MHGIFKEAEVTAERTQAFYVKIAVFQHWLRYVLAAWPWASGIIFLDLGCQLQSGDFTGWL